MIAKLNRVLGQRSVSGLLLLAIWLFSVLVLAVEPQWETLTPPPGSEECAGLFEDTVSNSFTKGWERTESYLESRKYYKGPTPPPYLKVLFPSMTLPYSVIGSIKNIEVYELRGFCPEVMNVAKDSNAYLVIATSVSLEEATVRNCVRLAMMESVPPEDLEDHVETIMKKRIFLINAENSSYLPLAQKFLQNPNKMRELKTLIDGIKVKYGIPQEGAYMQTFVTTPQEGWVSDRLGISVWGNPVMNASVESKSTYHKIAEQAGIKKADAETDILSEEHLVQGIYNLMQRNLKRMFLQYTNKGSAEFSLPLAQDIYDGLLEKDKIEVVKKLMQKWNQGTSGQGNAPKLISEEAISAFFSENKELALSVIRRNLTQNMETADSKMITPERFINKLVSDGGVVEQFIPYVQTFVNLDGQKLPVSPSGQADVRSHGISLMGCHEQKFISGVPGGVFEGAIYGWSRLGDEICRQVYKKTLILGKVLKKLGYLGRFAVDYVVAKDPVTQELEVVIIEINARSGGTHTVDAMVALTSANQYVDGENLADVSIEPYHWYAQVREPNGSFRRVKLFNEGTDNFYHPGLKLFCSDQELLDFLYQRNPIYWKYAHDVPMANSVNKRGILPHMIQGRKGSLDKDLKMGFLAIGHDSYEDANILFQSFEQALVGALDAFKKAHSSRTCK